LPVGSASFRHWRQHGIRVMQRRRKTGAVSPPRQGRPSGSGKLAPYRRFLIAQVEIRPDITMPELADKLDETHGVRVAPSSLSRVLVAEGFTYKKALMASERARATVRLSRDVWITKRQPRMRLEPHRLVFIDETSVNTKMVRLRGRGLRGDRLRMDAPFGHWGTQTFIAGLRCFGLTVPWIIYRPMNRAAFVTYIETQLAPTLSRGDVSAMLALSRHPRQPGRPQEQKSRRNPAG
jgi:transposase